MLTETWFQRRDRQLKSQLEEIESKHNISFIRNDRDKRGGGVSIAFNSSESDFKKIQLNCMKGKKFELIAAVGKLHGIQRKHIVISTYIPPSYKKAENEGFLECLVDTIAEAKTKHPGAWLTCGGD